MYTYIHIAYTFIIKDRHTCLVSDSWLDRERSSTVALTRMDARARSHMLRAPCCGMLEAWAWTEVALSNLEALPAVSSSTSWRSPESAARDPRPRPSQAPPRADLCGVCGCGPEDCVCFPIGLCPGADLCEACGCGPEDCACFPVGSAGDGAAEDAATQRPGGRRNRDGTLRPRGGKRRREWTAWFTGGGASSRQR